MNPLLEKNYYPDAVFSKPVIDDSLSEFVNRSRTALNNAVKVLNRHFEKLGRPPFTNAGIYHIRTAPQAIERLSYFLEVIEEYGLNDEDIAESLIELINEA